MRLHLKEYTADTKAEVAFGKYSQKLKQKKGKFIGSVTVPYEQVFTLFHFTFETNGVTKVQQLMLMNTVITKTFPIGIPFYRKM